MTNNEWVLSRQELAFKLYKAYAHSGSPSFYIEHWLRVADAARRALATPTKPEMQSVHPAAVSGKEETSPCRSGG